MENFENGLQTKVTTIHITQELINTVQEIWQSLTPMYIKSLYNSLPRRLRPDIAANGCITKY